MVLCCRASQVSNWTVRGSPNRLCNGTTSYLSFCSPTGACVNNVSGDSPLHIAARLSSPELVSVLLDHGANRSLRNSEGKQPLDLAPPNSLVERLLRQAGGSQPKLTKQPHCGDFHCLYINQNITLSWLSLLPDAFPGVSPLTQLCRLHIRKTVGKQRLGGIHDLPIPANIKQYLLYQSTQEEIKCTEQLKLSKADPKCLPLGQQGVHLHSHGNDKGM